MEKYLLKMMGEAVAILCVRYWYRGIVSYVGDGIVVLSNPFVVLSSENIASTKKGKEENIPSDLAISLEAIEQVCQPAWVWNDYEKKGGK